MKSELIKEFNLPTYIKGKSFAEASKAIDKKFSERNDSAAMETKQELMGRLAKAQEYVKMQESLKANAGQVPDMMNGQVPEGFEDFAPQNQMFNGGRLPVETVSTLQPNGVQMANPTDGIVAGDTSGLTAPGVEAPASGPGAAGVAGMATAALDFGTQMFGDTGVDSSGLAGRQEKGNVAMGALGSAAKGAQAGMALGPWGAAAGAVIGGAAGIIGGSKANKEIREGNMNASRIENNKYSNDFAWGGYMTDPTDPRKKVKAVDTTDINKGIINDSIYPITPVGGVENIINKGIETPKPDGSHQAAFLESVKYAGRKKATPGDVNPNAGIQPGGAFDYQFDNARSAPSTRLTTPTGMSNATAASDLSIGPSGNRGERLGVPAGMSDLEASADLSLTPSGNRPSAEVEKQKAYLASVEGIGTPPYDYYNDPDQKMKGQAQTEEMKAYLASKEGIDSKEETSIDGTVAEEDATPEQRKAIKALELKYKPSGVKLGSTLEESAKAVTDQLSKRADQKKARDARMQEIISEHDANKPENKFNASRLAEFAPAAMSAYQLAKLKKPERESLDRIDSRYKTDYVDERALENRVQNEHNNVSRALAGASNGSMGALRANLLGANKNKVQAMNDAYLKADDINRQEDKSAQQFNSRNDMVNLQQSNREKENAARDKGAYESNKSMLQANLAENIGGIGREATDRKSIAKMFGYNVDGDYVVGKDGKRKSWKEFEKEVKAYQKKNK